jgi:hypothetical protein
MSARAINFMCYNLRKKNAYMFFSDFFYANWSIYKHFSLNEKMLQCFKDLIELKSIQ